MTAPDLQPTLVGDRVTVGHRVILHGCTVEDDCLIGMGAILLNGVRVGKGSVVGAGAVLTEGKQYPPGSLIVGAPGRIVRPVDDELRKRIDLSWRHYVKNAVEHRNGKLDAADCQRCVEREACAHYDGDCGRAVPGNLQQRRKDSI